MSTAESTLDTTTPTPRPVGRSGARRDARHVPLTRAQRLAQDAAEATEIRRLAEHPDVVALRVETVRRLVDILAWLGLGLGLAFTMVNVQQFAADGAPAWSLPWLAAWLLDPMVSVVLIAVLRAEQVTARYQVATGAWVNRTKWFAFAATYVMNTWQSWQRLDPAAIVLHSIPPILVFLVSEAAPVLRDRLTESVHRAAQHSRAEEEQVVHEPTSADTEGVHDVGVAPAHEPVASVQEHASERPSANGSGRKLLADYVADARAMWEPGTQVTPAWARKATGCSKGLSSKVAERLRHELDEDDPTMSTGRAA